MDTTGIACVDQNTIPDSGLRRLLVAWFGWSAEMNWFAIPEVQLWLRAHAEVTFDLAMIWYSRLASRSKNPFLPSNGGPEQFFDKS